MAFKRDEYHELGIWKTLACETNDPVVAAWEAPDGNTHFSETSREIKRWFLGWLTDWHLYTYTYWISVLHCPVILHLKVTEAATRGVL